MLRPLESVATCNEIFSGAGCRFLTARVWPASRYREVDYGYVCADVCPGRTGVAFFAGGSCPVGVGHTGYGSIIVVANPQATRVAAGGGHARLVLVGLASAKHARPTSRTRT